MKIYILASFKMNPDPDRMEALSGWLNTGLGRFGEGGHFYNITSSDLSFLNDARRLVNGDPPPIFNSSFSNRRSKRSGK